jgi:Holliday junction resolvase-like predicted endonuclease
VTIKKAKMARNSNPRPERVAAPLVGLSAESRAAAYLVAKGYRIVTRRRGVLVFVEVKARNTLDDAALSLLPRQQQRIAAAAGALARRASRRCRKQHPIRRGAGRAGKDPAPHSGSLRDRIGRGFLV